MDKKPLIGVSILVVVLLVIGSLSNVVGYQVVKTSQEKTEKQTSNREVLLLNICKNLQRFDGTLPKLIQYLLFLIGFAFGVITDAPATIICFCFTTVAFYLLWHSLGNMTTGKAFIFALYCAFLVSLWFIFYWPYFCGKTLAEGTSPSLRAVFQHRLLKIGLGSEL